MRISLACLILAFTQTLSAQSILFNSEGGTPDPSSLVELRSTEKGFLAPRMQADDRLGISSPAQGLLVFQTNGTIGFYFYNGASWDTLGGATTTINVSNVTNIATSGIAVIRDEKAASTNGGTFTAGAWELRNLNNYDGDSSFVSLSGDTIILDSGTYVVSIDAPAYRVDEHQTRLFNSTTSTSAGVGTTAFSGNFAASSSTLIKVIRVTDSFNKFIVEHQCESTQLVNGFGIGATWGKNVYTQVKIEKL